MTEQGKVISIDGGFATVKVDKKDECAKCGLCMFPKNANSVNFYAENNVGANVGDTVIVTTKEKAKTVGILLVFGVPILLIVASLLIGYLLIKSETVGLITSIFSVVIWFFILSFIDKRLKKRSNFSSKIQEIVSKI